jgi:hypothetical protein
MNSIQETAREYEKSCESFRARIDELSGDILHYRRNGACTQSHELEARRFRLSAELAHMEESLADMRGYLAATRRTGKLRANCVRRTRYA